MIALLVPVFAATIASPGFAPPLDRPLQYSVSEVRADANRTLRFEIVRRVTFRAAGIGFTAEVETLSASGSAGPAGRMFEAMTLGLVGRRVILTLDRSGHAIDVADLDGVWGAQMSAMTTALASRNPERQATADTLLAPLRALPRSAKIARLGEMIAPLLGDPIDAPHVSRTITLPARAPDGTSALLPGTEQVTRLSDGSLRLERQADGNVAEAHTTVTQRRTIDPRTGLALETENVTSLDTAGARLIVTRTTRIISQVK